MEEMLRSFAAVRVASRRAGMTNRTWPELAEWYDQKQGDEGDIWHRTLLDPVLFAMIGDVNGLRVLDVPCGNGHNWRRLARSGASVTGIDSSAPIIARNQVREQREPCGIQYHAADAASMSVVNDDCFDLVISQMGFMDIPDAAGAIVEMGRVLVKGGRLVAMFSHPCFDIPESSIWIEESTYPTSTVWRKLRRYFQPFEGKVYWRINGRFESTASYHRPLSWYVRSLRKAGLVLTALEEPVPTPAFAVEEPEWSRRMSEVPMHILVEARKTAL
jgi:ubiquinone/menaquinone biosynthesis C-methylase UbiE